MSKSFRFPNDRTRDAFVYDDDTDLDHERGTILIRGITADVGEIIEVWCQHPDHRPSPAEVIEVIPEGARVRLVPKQ